ncbi:MAG: hypothetical protein ACT4QF_19680 [Sporichthyaceae bacterium]
MADHSQTPPKRRRPWPGVLLAVLGSGLITVALAIPMALVLALLFWQLTANVVMVAFVQEMRWYGPGVFETGGDLWWWVLGLGAAGGALLAWGAALLAKAGTPWRPWWRRRAA